jgi:hypothetical protein
MVRVIDGFLADPLNIRTQALGRGFHNAEQGGAVFPGIQMSNTADWERICVLAGVPVRKGVEFYRLYMEGQAQPTYIHTDSDLNEWSAILYLSDDPETGTAFWEPLHDGADVFDDSQWRQHMYVGAKFNRLVIFPSKLWHSRYPRNCSTGTTPESGRLIQVFFF